MQGTYTLYKHQENIHTERHTYGENICRERHTNRGTLHIEKHKYNIYIDGKKKRFARLISYFAILTSHFATLKLQQEA